MIRIFFAILLTLSFTSAHAGKKKGSSSPYDSSSLNSQKKQKRRKKKQLVYEKEKQLMYEIEALEKKRDAQRVKLLEAIKDKITKLRETCNTSEAKNEISKLEKKRDTLQKAIKQKEESLKDKIAALKEKRSTLKRSITGEKSKPKKRSSLTRTNAAKLPLKALSKPPTCFS